MNATSPIAIALNDYTRLGQAFANEEQFNLLWLVVPSWSDNEGGFNPTVWYNQSMKARPLPPRLQRDRALQLFVERVRQLPHPPEMVVLYGSRARGDHRPNSDYDILVVLPHKSAETVNRLYEAVQEVEISTLRLISLLIRTREQYEICRARGERVLRDAEKEGYLLWSPSFGSAFEPSGTKEKSG